MNNNFVMALHGVLPQECREVNKTWLYRDYSRKIILDSDS